MVLGKLFKIIFEIIGALILIVFGILFFAYLPHDFSEISTDAIFVGAGILFLRKAFTDRKNDRIRDQTNRKKQKNMGTRKTGKDKLT